MTKIELKTGPWKKADLAGQTFPEDYDMGDNDAGYICGMSVPPFMMQRIANQIHEQLLNG